MLHARPETHPGRFKEVANRAGDTLFVTPELVVGTMTRGLSILPSLADPFQRAVFMMFFISETHPFNDGNGRLARAMMNAELIAGGQRRIIIPTAYRDDYLGGLRRLSRQDDPRTLIQVLDFAQRFTAAIDFRNLDEAGLALEECGAFRTGEDARLRMPRADRNG
jgi:Fic family protein